MTGLRMRSIGYGGRLRANVASVGDDAPRITLIPSVGEYPVYDEKLYSMMTADALRVEAFDRALRGCASGRTVVDIGTGAEANWALVAAEAGATKVWAIEALPESAEKARALIAERGFADVITVLTGDSRTIELPEPADVCVSETIGAIASSEGICEIFADAKRRLVRPSGIFIPHRVETVAVPFDYAAVLGAAGPAFQAEYALYVDRVFQSVGGPFDLRLCWTDVPDSGRLAAPTTVEVLEFGVADYDYAVHESRVRIDRAGQFGGIALGIRLWVSPDDQEPIDSIAQQTSWLPVFVPATVENPRAVAVGDEFDLSFAVQLSADRIHPDYQLTARFTDQPHADIDWDGKYLGGAEFRSTPFYRDLFAAYPATFRGE
ncbi:class I SAM-dependent methyltransferase [Nocardia altamirensis]|uniref:class I SAM-dependent methyltransferase n=1 Tax=Nocardia altamirensis TaxID=472158 RepID=UPI0014355A95|nr:class I SAM-dependent methyltransferase [Nocardia altamirensis]